MQQAAHGVAVFVDPTGRRHRLVSRAFWALGVLGVAYLALVVVSLLLPPSLSRLTVPGLGQVLPGPGAAPLGAAEGESEAPEVLLQRTPSPRPSPTTVRPTAAQAQPTRSAAPRTPSAPLTPAATPAQATGGPTAGPTQRASAAPAVPPGQVDRTPKPRPSASRGPG